MTLLSQARSYENSFNFKSEIFLCIYFQILTSVWTVHARTKHHVPTHLVAIPVLVLRDGKDKTATKVKYEETDGDVIW